MSEIGGKNLEIPCEVMAKPLVTIVEEVENTNQRKRGYAECSNKCGYGKELKVQEVVNEEVIIGGEDHISQYLKNENVKIITVKEPFHQQLVRELLMQPEKDEQTKNNQQEGKVQQMEEELHARALLIFDQQWQEVVNDMEKQLVVMENGASTNGDLDAVVE
jgi:hypothetical protein